MADPFGDQKNDGEADKRPNRTIEGTAEEVPGDTASAETAAEGADQAALGAPESEAEEESQAEGQGDETGAEAAAADDREADASETSPSETDPSDEETVAAPPPPRSGGGFFSHLMAGVVGGIVGVVALFLAVTYYPSLVTKSSPELEARLAALEDKAPASPVSEEQVSALDDRVAKLESAIDSMAEQADKGGSVADAAAISQQVDDAERRLEDKIDQRLAELPSGDSNAGSADMAALAGLRSQIDGLKSEVASLSQTQSDENAGEAVEKADVDALESRIADLEGKLPGLSSAVEKTGTEARSAALAASLADLRAAVQSGGPYRTELSAYKALAPSSAELAPLPAHAAKGVPTMPELIAAYEPATDKAFAAEVEPAQEGFFDTLISSAGSVVRVRKLDGAGEGNGTEAILTRAKNALEEGELAKAVKEVESLKPEPKEAMADWLDQAKARRDAQATLKRLTSSDAAGAASDNPPEEGEPASTGL